MKILVAVKRVVDYNVRVHPSEDASALETLALKHSINPFDEIAVERAVQLREKGFADEVIAVTIGPDKAVDQLRTAMAIGADRAVHVRCEARMDPASAAAMIAELARREGADLVMTGKQAVDDDAAQTASMVSAMLDVPLFACANSIEISGSLIRVGVETDEGTDVLEGELPAVVSADLRLAQPRYVTLPSMMKARKKPVATVTPEELGVIPASDFEPVRYEEPAGRSAARILSGVDELIDVLRNTHKAI